MTEPYERAPADEARTSKAQTAFALVLLLALLALFLVGLVSLYPDRAPQPTDANFLDSIFADRTVLFAARLVLFSAAVVAFFAGAYIIVSIVKWMGRGLWLRRAGPFEVAEEAVAELRGEIERWKGVAEGDSEELVDLREQLRKTDGLVDRLWDRINDLENENVELQAQQPPNS